MFHLKNIIIFVLLGATVAVGIPIYVEETAVAPPPPIVPSQPTRPIKDAALSAIGSALSPVIGAILRPILSNIVTNIATGLSNAFNPTGTGAQTTNRPQKPILRPLKPLRPFKPRPIITIQEPNYQLQPHPELNQKPQAQHPTPVINPQPYPDLIPQPHPDLKPQPHPDLKPQPHPDLKPQPHPEINPQHPDLKPYPTPLINPQPYPEIKPESEYKPHPFPPSYIEHLEAYVVRVPGEENKFLIYGQDAEEAIKISGLEINHEKLSTLEEEEIDSNNAEDQRKKAIEYDDELILRGLKSKTIY